MRTVRILGTHGVPAGYGGFETAAEAVARYLVGNGWRVVVYCQEPDHGQGVITDEWEGIERVRIPIARDGWLGTAHFDLVSIGDAVKHRDICLTFGYNTAIFNLRQKLAGIPNVINMDGIEWSRARWGKFRQAILWANERIACWIGDELIADHPEIAVYLRGRARAEKITTITYGAPLITSADPAPVSALGLTPGGYLTLIARPIPENSILELVQGFSAQPRPVELVLLGDYGDDPYHQAVRAAASDQVRFPGAIYDPTVTAALRFHSAGYLHGHTVGGTNPSLVEALGAGNPVVAHDNPYNRWVAQDAALYFSDVAGADQAITRLTSEPGLADTLRLAARARHAAEFTWEHVAGQYEQLLLIAMEGRK